MKGGKIPNESLALHYKGTKGSQEKIGSRRQAPAMSASSRAKNTLERGVMEGKSPALQNNHGMGRRSEENFSWRGLPLGGGGGGMYRKGKEGMHGAGKVAGMNPRTKRPVLASPTGKIGHREREIEPDPSH